MLGNGPPKTKPKPAWAVHLGDRGEIELGEEARTRENGRFMPAPKRPVIAIDMDEVTADALSRHLSLYNAHYGASLTPDDLQGRPLREIVPEAHREQLQAFVHGEGFFKDLGVMPHSREVIRDLQEKYDVYISTAAMEFRNSFVDKYDWLAEHFPFIPWSHIVFCGDKGILAADYLIDDHPKNFVTFRGEGILYTAPHNLKVTGYRRVADWLEVRRMFLS
jgi:5'(3')-deoxyribonucleotidase